MMQTTTHAERTAAEELVGQYCRAAHLGETQAEVVRLHLVSGLKPAEIKPLTGVRHLSQVRALLDAGLRRICDQPGAREMLRQAVDPEQFRRVVGEDERPATVEDLMRGPQAAEPGRRYIGRMWTEVCFLPGQTRGGVKVQMAEEIRRVG